ncbi:hypothetical protein CHU98_g5379 [Xylaria longipes]|nr:hypothetical protein CHU98_g5379 [Xylaria longipes]
MDQVAATSISPPTAIPRSGTPTALQPYGLATSCPNAGGWPSGDRRNSAMLSVKMSGPVCLPLQHGTLGTYAIHGQYQ